VSERIGLKGIIFNSEKNIKPEDVDPMLSKLEGLYFIFRDEYLI
jgi:hypothetical protein